METFLMGATTALSAVAFILALLAYKQGHKNRESWWALKEDLSDKIRTYMSSHVRDEHQEVE